MGEAKRRSKTVQAEISKAIGVQTVGGKVQVRWDNKSDATPFGRMIFFIEFLTIAYHSYQMAGLRLVLGVDVEAGNPESFRDNYTMPGLMKMLDKLSDDKQPYFVRGDAGLGSEDMLSALELRNLRYLFKLRITAKVKRYIERVFWSEGWDNAGQGWEAREGELKLSGWSRSRRVIVMRRPLKGEIALADDQQMIMGFAETERPIKKYEYAVLVTDLSHEVVTIAQLYRDRADSENAFDELKNECGWGGFTTQDLKRCRLTANGSGAGIQLVVIVCETGQSQSTTGGDYEQTISAVRGCQTHHAFRAAASEHHDSAWQCAGGAGIAQPCQQYAESMENRCGAAESEISLAIRL